ncbi:MAG: hypothetical protein Q4C49_06835 [Bacillota bacterium]|nr:hypothetical protein [Bacillota bacterium]
MFAQEIQMSFKFFEENIFLLKLLGSILIFVGFFIAVQLNQKYHSRFSLFISVCLFVGYRVFFLMLNSKAKIEYILICVSIQLVLFLLLIVHAKNLKKNPPGE